MLLHELENPLAGAAKGSGWRTFAAQLGGIISHGMDFLNPGHVVIGTDTPELEERIGPQVLEFVQQHTVTGLVSTARLPIRFSPLQTDTLARGAIMPHLHELSLTPLLYDSVLG